MSGRSEKIVQRVDNGLSDLESLRVSDDILLEASKTFVAGCSVMGGYVGAKVPASAVEPYQRAMENYLGAVKNNLYSNNRINRSGGDFHITVFAPREWRRIKKQKVGIDFSQHEFKFHLLGLGEVSNDTSTALFIVVESSEAQEFRASFGLEEHDFHITLGFSHTDVHGLPKGVSTIIKKELRRVDKTDSDML